MSTEWTSLEITKIAVSCLTPVAVAILGVYFHRLTKRFEHSQWRHQKIIEKRLAIYDSLAPKFNELLCYFTHVGEWRDIAPPDIVQKKRKIDKEIYLAQPLFSDDFFRSCTEFMHVCYATYQGWGEDARLRTEYADRKTAHANWKKEWNECFSGDQDDHDAVRAAYSKVMHAFSADLGLNQK